MGGAEIAGDVGREDRGHMRKMESRAGRRKENGDNGKQRD